MSSHKRSINDNMMIKTSGNVATKITKNILNETLDISTWTVLSIFFIGKATLDMLYNPTYYVKDPHEFLGEVDYFLRKKAEKKSLQRSLTRLQKYGLVEKNKDTISLTKIGKKLMQHIFEIKQTIDKKWDGKHRLVIFDIPEKQKHHRNWLRSELYFLGYIQLQRSVFVSKFPLTVTIIKEIKKRKIDKGVNYLLVDKIYDIAKMKDLLY